MASSPASSCLYPCRYIRSRAPVRSWWFMRKLLVVAGVAVAMMAGTTEADACGDKLLALGRGVRFARAYKAPHPASILVFERSDGNKGSAKADVALVSLLQQAGAP